MARGRKATSGEFPFHAALFLNLLYRCGGSLISSKAVVTAAHCVVYKKDQIIEKERLKLLFGSVDLKVLKATEALREVEELIIHSDYRPKPIEQYDIALIIIKGILQFSGTISPICLYESQTPIENDPDHEFAILGFGYTEENTHFPSRYLKHGEMTLIERDLCISFYKFFYDLPKETTFCAKSVRGQVTCPGDSGGEFFRCKKKKLLHEHS